MEEIRKPADIFYWDLYFNFLNIALHCYLIVSIVHSGAGLHSEGRRIVEIASQVMNKPGYDVRQKIDLVFVLTQFKARNAGAQNVFFRVDWSTFLVVKYGIYNY